jgi:hypothetical protein
MRRPLGSVDGVVETVTAPLTDDPADAVAGAGFIHTDVGCRRAKPRAENRLHPIKIILVTTLAGWQHPGLV